MDSLSSIILLLLYVARLECCNNKCMFIFKGMMVEKLTMKMSVVMKKVHRGRRRDPKVKHPNQRSQTLKDYQQNRRGRWFLRLPSATQTALMMLGRRLPLRMLLGEYMIPTCCVYFVCGLL